MKLIIAIVQDEDASRLISQLMNDGFGVTKLATTGGFLRAGNTTLLVGVDDDRFQAAMDVIEKVCKSRKQIAPSPASMVGMPAPTRRIPLRWSWEELPSSYLRWTSLSSCNPRKGTALTQIVSAATPPVFPFHKGFNAGVGVVVNQFLHRQMVHAYLLTGARGLGKRTLARTLASALFCTSENKPCGHCEACRRVLDGNEPDVLTLFADDGKQIGVDRVREVIQKTNQHAFGDGWRVVLIEPVEKMTPQAQNALLKSLEEPVAQVVFLLMTHELTATLGTIASRCVRVKLSPWPDEQLKAALLQAGYPMDRVEAVLPRSAGNIGRRSTCCATAAMGARRSL